MRVADQNKNTKTDTEKCPLFLYPDTAQIMLTINENTN